MIEPLALARAGAEVLGLLPGLANRHGLVAGATGTGKTVTLQVLAEQFSRIGVPAFMADVKGDLSGRSEEHTSELQSLRHLVCRLLLEKKKKIEYNHEDQNTRHSR